MLVQQQMRNTHFGDGGFGFNSNFGKFRNADMSIDSDRKISRKRGAATKTNITKP